MDALVCSGGSIKGSYQAGAIAAVLDAGYRPQVVTGTSVGALNAAFLAAHQPRDPAQWPVVGGMLADFWCEQVTGPDRFVRKRGILALAWRVWRNQWAGLVDTDPLEDVVRTTLSPFFPRAGGIACRVAAVNLRTGTLEYVAPSAPGFLDAVMASTAEPVLMPTRPIGADRYVDGGVREITPLAEAIRLGATRIVCVVCQPEVMGHSGADWGNVMALIGRVTAIASNEIVNNDLRHCQEVNAAILAGAAPGKRLIEVTVIRPAKELRIALESFGPVDIARMVDQGETDARRVLALAKAA